MLHVLLKPEGAAQCGQSQVEGNGSMVLGRDNCQKAKWRLRQHGSMSRRVRQKMYFFFSLRFQIKDWQEHSALVMATGASPSQPHISSQSHLVDRGPLTRFLRVPEEPFDSSSTRPYCYQAPATGATGFLRVWLLCISLGTSACCVSLSSWRNMKHWRSLKEEMRNGCWQEAMSLTRLCLDPWDATEHINWHNKYISI